MFTGLIQDMGKVISASRVRGNLRLAIETGNVSSRMERGSSICVNGACLTVIKPGRRFEVEVAQETLSRTNLLELRAGARVNLENPMTPSSLFGGHFVTGHVDTTARIKSIKQQSGSQLWEIEIPEVVERYIVEKGSVCVEGVSLTVALVKARTFTASLIPHTLTSTTLKDRRPDDKVNIEADILAKHIEKLMNRDKETIQT